MSLLDTIRVYFDVHFHPYVDALTKCLVEGSVKGLLESDTWDDEDDENVPSAWRRPLIADDEDGSQPYAPTPWTDTDASGVYAEAKLQFEPSGAYSVYNWELFFHAPLGVAIHLSKAQRFAEARDWFHYIFDPSATSRREAPARFWQFMPFRDTPETSLKQIIAALQSTTPDHRQTEIARDVISCLNAWTEAPFRPHVVARFRPGAYMVKTLMAYLDNLIAWGDSLFAEDTGESVNEATQLYVMAANLLGRRPQLVPRKRTVASPTYDSIRNAPADEGYAARIENEIPFGLFAWPPSSVDEDAVDDAIQMLRKHALLDFCLPKNDKLLGYWDTVADRLFKIRNSLNLKGIFRQLPLYEPPIDPALLVRATAAGLSIEAILRGMNQPLPLVRYRMLSQKAAEICQEVKSLGANILACMEKEDAEALSILRARHETALLGLAESIKYGQWQEAVKSREGLQMSLNGAVYRYKYYEKLLGGEVGDLSSASLDKLGEFGVLPQDFLDQMSLTGTSEPQLPPDDIDIDLASGVQDKRKISKYEAKELDKLKAAQKASDQAITLEILGSVLGQIPNFTATTGWGDPAVLTMAFTFGGSSLAAIMSALANSERGIAGREQFKAGKAGKMGSYQRREQEWEHQRNVAAGEITQVVKQIRAAQVREAVAKREWDNHKAQIAQAKEIEQFLTDERKGKRTNKEFYAWMKGETRRIYGQYFDLAFDVAKKAERALQHELGDPSLTYIQYGHLAGKEGLFAGEKLHLDLHRMEMAYHELNEREYELTTHVSLREINPAALLALRATGACAFDVREELLDLECPGHYFRRIKSVAVTVPCVTGPYASVDCTLSLQTSEIRTSPLLRDGSYERTGDDDDRFSGYRGRIESIVASSAQADGGLFETNLHDERYLPFEGSGVIGTWLLTLPGNNPLGAGGPRTFDYDTIADVVLHVRYTAREGGGLLKSKAIAHVIGEDDEGNGYAQLAGLTTRLFDIRHEFPTEWAAFMNSSGNALTLPVAYNHFPFWCRKTDGITVSSVLVCGTKADEDGADPKINTSDSFSPPSDGSKVIPDPRSGFATVDLVSPGIELSEDSGGSLTLYINNKNLAEFWIVCPWE